MWGQLMLRPRSLEAAGRMVGGGPELAPWTGHDRPGLVLLRRARPVVAQAARPAQTINVRHQVNISLRAEIRQPREPRKPQPVIVMNILALTPRRAEAAPPLIFYRGAPGAPLAFRRGGARAAVSEAQYQVQRITSVVQSRVVHEISQASPWRHELREALRSPEVLRQLTDRIGRAIDRRADVDRYRRGQ